jgi:hypothetical protein
MIEEIIFISTNPIFYRIEEQIYSIKYYCDSFNIKFSLFKSSHVKKSINQLIPNLKNTLIIVAKNQMDSSSLNINRILKRNNIKILNLNTEQLCYEKHLKLIKNSLIYCDKILDYSFINNKQIEKINIKSFVLPHLFYTKKYFNLEIKKDIDVLFLGHFTGDRIKIYQKLLNLGIKSLIVQNDCFGENKINLLCRTKIIVDINRDDYLYNPNPHRCVPAFYYGCIVLSSLPNEEENKFYQFVEKIKNENIAMRIKNILENYDFERKNLYNNLLNQIEKINQEHLNYYHHFLMNYNDLLVIMSSKNPNENLIKNIENIFKFYPECHILIVDSNSYDFSIYQKIKIIYPKVELAFIKNINFEFGAYKYGYQKYSNFNKYLCIQDYFIIKDKIDLTKVNDNTSFTYHSHHGYSIGMGCLKRISKIILNNTKVLQTYEKLHPFNFCQAQHNSFLVSNKILKLIINELPNLPKNNKDSTAYQFIFGLFFIHFKIKTLPMNNFL